MKELSIEKKAKAYDKALVIAKSRYSTENEESVRICLELMFPELQENEDEILRKELMQYLKDYPNLPNGNYCRNDFFAWLEEQGEHIKFLKSIQIGDKVTRNEDGVLVNLSQLNRVAKKDEKQSEQKETLCDKCRREQPSHSCQDIAELGRCALEHQSKQKPADKTEPKFKNGQWIVWQDKCYKVNYNGCGYELVDQDGLSTSFEYGTIDETAHLWDITQDAKAGDVLATKDIVFIFKHMDKTGLSLCKSYCEVIGNSKLGLGFDFSINDVTPATKEQSGLLFQKMEEAGYEWDAEKKELKKIDQKSAWSEDDERIRQCLIRDQEKALDEVRNDKYGHSEIISDLKEMYRERIDWLMTLKPQPKQEWSKEDEKIIKRIDSLLYSQCTIHGSEYEGIHNWLKSLKERMKGGIKYEQDCRK